MYHNVLRGACPEPKSKGHFALVNGIKTEGLGDLMFFERVEALAYLVLQLL